jgi:hypothetical protein
LRDPFETLAGEGPSCPFEGEGSKDVVSDFGEASGKRDCAHSGFFEEDGCSIDEDEVSDFGVEVLGVAGFMLV